jgi:Asp/Glu/hydantoin racemase
MPSHIVVINPNSSDHMTKAMARALRPWNPCAGLTFECVTLTESPSAIETRDDIAVAAVSVVGAVRSRPEATMFVVACFSDPGLRDARRVASPRQRVLGIGESSMLAACAVGRRFGIISSAAESTLRHLRYVRECGIESRLAADLPTELGVLESGSSRGIERAIEVGRSLRDEHGADVLILGCAAMVGLGGRIEEELCIPVVDPVVATFGLAAGLAAPTRVAATAEA